MSTPPPRLAKIKYNFGGKFKKKQNIQNFGMGKISGCASGMYNDFFKK